MSTDNNSNSTIQFNETNNTIKLSTKIDKDIIFGLKSDHLDTYSMSPSIVQFYKDHNEEFKVNSATYFLTTQTKIAFLKMQAKAKEDGFDLEIASAFRSFDRQQTIFNSKMLGQRTILDEEEQPVSNFNTLPLNEKVRLVLLYSAIPGLSRHHYGTDLDVYSPTFFTNDYNKLQLTNIEYSTGNQAPVAKWLTNNMHKFGFFRPYHHDVNNVKGELWHISYAPEADIYTKSVSLDDVIKFISKQNLEGSEFVIDVIKKEFDYRFKIFS